jgi:hypothetical protein
MGEIDVAFEGAGGDDEDDLPAVTETSMPVTKPGELWLLEEHRILCANALMPESYVRLLGDERAQMIFTDPPWNIPIAGHVSGLGSTKHGDFAMGCGEMSAAKFEDFLRTTLGHAARCSDDGSIHFICMHWGKIRELLTAAADLYSETKNLCVWNKSNAGMGSLYRSKHELIFVFKRGDAPHINNVELGRFGRNRTNIWDYPSQNVLNGTTKSKLSLHPTAKPVALVADAIRDCSNRHGVKAEDDLKVGYKRPPRRSRFQPGRSGNPRGRQKAVRNLRSDVKRTLETPVRLNEQGRARRVSTQEAALLRLREKALKGDARSLDRLLELAQTFNSGAAIESFGENSVAAEDQAILDAYAAEILSRAANLSGMREGADEESEPNVDE